MPATWTRTSSSLTCGSALALRRPRRARRGHDGGPGTGCAGPDGHRPRRRRRRRRGRRSCGRSGRRGRRPVAARRSARSAARPLAALTTVAALARSLRSPRSLRSARSTRPLRSPPVRSPRSPLLGTALGAVAVALRPGPHGAPAARRPGRPAGVPAAPWPSRPPPLAPRPVPPFAGSRRVRRRCCVARSGSGTLEGGTVGRLGARTGNPAIGLVLLYGGDEVTLAHLGGAGDAKRRGHRLQLVEQHPLQTASGAPPAVARRVRGAGDFRRDVGGVAQWIPSLDRPGRPGCASSGAGLPAVTPASRERRGSLDTAAGRLSRSAACRTQITRARAAVRSGRAVAVERARRSSRYGPPLRH